MSLGTFCYCFLCRDLIVNTILTVKRESRHLPRSETVRGKLQVHRSKWLKRREGIIGQAAPNLSGFREVVFSVPRSGFRICLSLSSAFSGKSFFIVAGWPLTIPGPLSASFIIPAKRELSFPTGSSKNSNRVSSVWFGSSAHP